MNAGGQGAHGSKASVSTAADGVFMDYFIDIAL